MQQLSGMDSKLKLSVVIPAHNEEGCLQKTVEDLTQHLDRSLIPHEIVVINDHSKDSTEAVLKELVQKYRSVVYYNNTDEGGFGLAIRHGLVRASGDAVAVYMADASDRPEDLVKFYRTMIDRDVDCVFGTRFSPYSRIYDYPKLKLVLNRIANKAIQLIFGLKYNDCTNAFKLYRREVIEGAQPFLSHHFNLTVELPLKAIIRGYSFAIVPNDWINRETGESKLKIREMGSRYLFIMIYCFIEKWLSRGDYVRREAELDQNVITSPSQNDAPDRVDSPEIH